MSSMTAETIMKYAQIIRVADCEKLKQDATFRIINGDVSWHLLRDHIKCVMHKVPEHLRGILTRKLQMAEELCLKLEAEALEDEEFGDIEEWEILKIMKTPSKQDKKLAIEQLDECEYETLREEYKGCPLFSRPLSVIRRYYERYSPSPMKEEFVVVKQEDVEEEEEKEEEDVVVPLPTRRSARRPVARRLFTPY